jgi:hypothetical protein
MRRRLLLGNGYWYWQGDPFEFVDLGLPSGTLWMKFDLGVTGDKYSGYGGYGQIGSSEIYPNIITIDDNGNQVQTVNHIFGWSTSVVNGNNSEMNEEAITNWISEHTTNNILNLDVDAVYLNSNGVARMPTKDEIQELLDYTNLNIIDSPIYGLTNPSCNGFSEFFKFANKSDSSKFILVGLGARCSTNNTPSYSSMTYGFASFPSAEFDPSSSTHALYGYNNNIFGDGGIENEVELNCGYRFRGVKV